MFSLTNLEIQGLILGLICVSAIAVLVSMMAYCLFQFDESHTRKQRKSLHDLKGIGSIDSNGAVLTVHKVKQDRGVSVAGFSGAINSLNQAINVAIELPVVRVFAKPIVSKIEQRQAQALRDSCVNDLPEMIDILLLALGAGLSVDQAFDWYLSRYDTPLADEFRRAEQVYQAGMLSRMKAFEQLADSLQEEAVLRFVNALRQAFSLGSPLGTVLGTFSRDVREYRIARLEERIAKTPVKILAPLGLCIVPAVLILLMGPIMAQVLTGMGNF